MRALQLALHRSWDHLDDSFLVSWSDDCLQDLLWWMDRDRLCCEVSLSQLSLDLDFWSDASDVSWGAHLGPEVASGLWPPKEASLSINARELLAVERGLLHFRSSVSHSTVAVFADNSMAMAYLRSAGGTRSPALSSIAQHIPLWSELHHVRLAPQFIMACHNVLADSLSLSSGPEPGVQMDSPHGGLPGALLPVAGHGRLFCYLSKSPLPHLFLTLPKSSGDGDGCSTPILGPPPGLRVSSLGYDSTGP